MATSRIHEVKITGDEYLALGELRWLVQQLEGAPDDLGVQVSFFAGRSGDGAVSQLKVAVPDGLSKPPNPIAPYPNLRARQAL